MKQHHRTNISGLFVFILVLLAGMFAISNIYAASNCINDKADGFPCHNVDLLSQVSLADMQVGKGRGSDLWGWTDELTGKEYVLFGHSLGVSFIDISDPENAIYLGQLPSRIPNPNVRKKSDYDWQDISVYANYAYIVSEAEGTGLQVFDLLELRGRDGGNHIFTSTYDYTGFGHAHNIAINQDSGFAYVVGSFDCEAGGLLTFDLSTPELPVFDGCLFGDSYTHDTQCVNYHGPDTNFQGTELCFNSNPDYEFVDRSLNMLAIVDVSDKSQPATVSSTTYPGARYTHQGWLTEDHSWFLVNDESDKHYFNPNTRTIIFDVRELDNPVFVGEYFGVTRAIDHNLYTYNGLLFEANYTAGLSVLSLDDIANGQLTEIGFFDVHPENNQRQLLGAWSVYPFFNSGSVAISSIDRGLFIVRVGPGRDAVPASARKKRGKKTGQ